MTTALEVRGLTKRFGGIVVAESIAARFEAGRIVGLIGPNGAGKSSFFNLVTGVVPADAGAVLINGTDATRLPMHARARLGVARTWQHVRLFASLTVLENLMIAPRRYHAETPLALVAPGRHETERRLRERAMAQLEKVRMVDFAQRRPGELSFGKQRLISLARALMNDGNVLLLDEPMAGVEGPAYEAIKALVRAEAAGGRAVCIVEHNISFVRDLCDSALFMFQGRILRAGTVSELIASPELTELYFGT
ncbi:MAG: ATP-binding cassette domain-containing protein [Alphaproteobacteria bacterium]|nr:ATP-binding cassette domain-containing protein [Alphaproteobacteria bacterium]